MEPREALQLTHICLCSVLGAPGMFCFGWFLCSLFFSFFPASPWGVGEEGLSPAKDMTGEKAPEEPLPPSREGQARRGKLPSGGQSQGGWEPNWQRAGSQGQSHL